MFEVNASLPSHPFAQILAIDFETYYDSDYTLSKMSTSEYVRDARFQAYGAGIKTISANQSDDESNWISAAALGEFLGRFDAGTTAILCHNTAFDGLILSHHYNFVPLYYLDTMSIARGAHDHSIGASLDEVSKYYGRSGKLGGAAALAAVKGKRTLTQKEEVNLAAYCLVDVDEMVSIFFEMITNYPEDELDLIHITLNAFCNPVLEVDRDLARKELVHEVERRERNLNAVQHLILDSGLYEDIHESLQALKPYKTIKGAQRGAELARRKRAAIPSMEKVQTLLSSNKTFPMLIKRLGETVATKPGKKGPIPAISKNDLELQRLQASDTPGVAEVVEARLNVKSTIGESRAARLIAHSVPRLPIMLNYCKAHTMRWSGGDKLNPQNFPAARKGNPARLRRSIKAPYGFVVGVADSSQIEDRMNCWLAGQDDILQIYTEDGDAYGYQAEQIYQAPPGSITKDTDYARRNQGKVARLGLGYGCGVAKYQLINQIGALGPAQPHFSYEDAERDVNAYRNSNKKIVNLWGFLGDEMLATMMRGEDYIWTPPHADRPLMTFHARGVDMINGLTLWYPDLKAKPIGKSGYYYDYNYKKNKEDARGKIYGGLFCENIVQCMARIVVGEQMLRIAQRYRIVMMTHDEIIFLMPEAEADEGLAWALDIMSQPPVWAQTLPVAAEGGYDYCYSK